MEYTMSERDGMLHVRAWGRETPQMPPEVCGAIMQEAKRTGAFRILVELTQKVALSGVSQYNMIHRMPAMGVTPQHRIALVHHTPGIYEASDMIDIVAGNRGLNVRNFRDLDSALAWLAPA
jgi:hypothetical protein